MNNAVTPDIAVLIEERKWYALRGLLAQRPPPEIADILFALDPPDRALVFRILPRHLAADVFASLSADAQHELLADLTDDETQRLLAHLRPDDRTELLEELPGQVTQRLLNLLTPDDLAEARQLLGYPPESVGRLMTPDYVAVRPHWTIDEALRHIRERGRDSETIDVIYVTDDAWHLLDSLELRRFILASPAMIVEDIMDRAYVAILAAEDREEAVRAMQRYDLVALPVVDGDGVLLGIVTVDDVLDVAQEEATEDFQKAAAVAPLRASYREADVLSLYRKRIGWLGILIVVNLVSSGVIAAYEEVLASVIALAFFIPLLIDSGGNTGAQSATLMVRALATGDLATSQWLRAAGKEVLVGVLLGLSMGLAGALLGLWRGGWEVGVIVGLAMIAIVLTANLIGVALPFLLIRLRIDPAVASSPLVTTLVDATGLFIYFTIAVQVFRMLGT